MNMIRHNDERMEIIPAQHAISMPQSRHHHLRNLRTPRKQRATLTLIQKAINGYECLASRNESFWWKYPIRGKAAMQSKRNKQSLLFTSQWGKRLS
jgi:hypothetical protein